MPKCKGTTVAGNPCKVEAIKGEEYCGNHQDQSGDGHAVDEEALGLEEEAMIDPNTGFPAAGAFDEVVDTDISLSDIADGARPSEEIEAMGLKDKPIEKSMQPPGVMLRTMFDRIWAHFMEDGASVLDYGEFERLALQFGFLKQEPYNPEVHGEADGVNPGEMINVRT